jgi:hypothetical protein
MAYDEDLANRLRGMVNGTAGLSEKRMMGGLCFFLNGNMFAGADRNKSGQRRFLFRVGKENDAVAARLPGGEVMVQGGRRMSGFYFVDADESDDAKIGEWLSLAVSHVLTLPPK